MNDIRPHLSPHLHVRAVCARCMAGWDGATSVGRRNRAQRKGATSWTSLSMVREATAAATRTPARTRSRRPALGPVASRARVSFWSRQGHSRALIFLCSE